MIEIKRALLEDAETITEINTYLGRNGYVKLT